MFWCCFARVCNYEVKLKFRLKWSIYKPMLNQLAPFMLIFPPLLNAPIYSSQAVLSERRGLSAAVRLMQLNQHLQPRPAEASGSANDSQGLHTSAALRQQVMGIIRERLDEAFPASSQSHPYAHTERLSADSDNLYAIALQYGWQRLSSSTLGSDSTPGYSGLSAAVALGTALDRGFSDAMGALDALDAIGAGGSNLQKELLDARRELALNWDARLKMLAAAAGQGAAFGIK